MAEWVALTHVERLESFTVEGHVYTDGARAFLVYTAGRGKVWSACETDEARTFSRDLVKGAAGKRACLAQLRELLNQEADERIKRMAVEMAENGWQPDDAV